MTITDHQDRQQTTPSPPRDPATSENEQHDEPAHASGDRDSPPPYSADQQCLHQDDLQALKKELEQVHRSHELDTQALEALEARIVRQEARFEHVAEHYEATIQACNTRIKALQSRVNSDLRMANATTHTVDTRITQLESDIRALRTRITSGAASHRVDRSSSSSPPSPIPAPFVMPNDMLGRPLPPLPDALAEHRTHCARPKKAWRLAAKANGVTNEKTIPSTAGVSAVNALQPDMPRARWVERRALDGDMPGVGSPVEVLRSKREASAQQDGQGDGGDPGLWGRLGGAGKE
ncbi:hypothetical protein LTR85_001677 [Meristemomyces frigidus]|nr:hypothetical protein LTR85_001677 [Meristemomyces frigidus]